MKVLLQKDKMPVTSVFFYMFLNKYIYHHLEHFYLSSVDPVLIDPVYNSVVWSRFDFFTTQSLRKKVSENMGK